MNHWKRIGRHIWSHRERPNLHVFVRRNANPRRDEKYQVFHAHPGPQGGIIPQVFEYATTMDKAMKKARVHLRHWNDPRKWPK